MKACGVTSVPSWPSIRDSGVQNSRGERQWNARLGQNLGGIAQSQNGFAVPVLVLDEFERTAIQAQGIHRLAAARQYQGIE